MGRAHLTKEGLNKIKEIKLKIVLISFTQIYFLILMHFIVISM